MNRTLALAALSTAAFLLIASPAWAAEPPATSQPSGPLGTVLSELRKIQPPVFETATIETSLASKGKEFLPAMRQARAMGDKIVGDDELTTNRYAMPNGQGTTVDMSPREDRVHRLAETRIGVLDRAITRIDFGFNPPEVLTKWVESREPKVAPLPGQPQSLSAPAAAEAFPDFTWCSVFKGYSPVARIDEPQSSWPDRCLFAIDRKSNVTHIADAKALEDFFRKNLPVVQAEAAATLAVQAWLSLAQTIQDHAAFPIEAASLKAAKTDAGWTAQGRAAAGIGPGPGPRVRFNDAGFATVKLAFGADGKLKTATEEVKFRPGMRPICQSTKLLDPDPLVRSMAEQELRWMGRSAEQYLKARRAISSPAIQTAIDRIWQQILDDERDFGW
ncbi:MAG: hypothetical protein PHU85_04535 [Phycisphaerae bacterium]|nr:hypothetical protein [Phycisphaerae bacterium]